MHNIEIRLEQTLDTPLSRVDPYGDRPEDTSDKDTITRLDEIDKLVIDAERDRMWCLPIRNSIRRLLKPDDLLVGKFGSVVDERHRSLRIADIARAPVGLRDPPAVDLGLDGVLAD